MQTAVRTCRILLLLSLLCMSLPSFAREIRGVIEDGSHASIAGATVTLVQGSNRQNQITGVDGSFEFVAVSAEQVQIEVEGQGFAEAHRTVKPGTTNLVFSIILDPERVRSEIVVTASRTALPIAETPESVQVLSREELESSGALAIDDVLRNIAGFDLFRRNSSRTANPTTQGVSLRGVGSSGASRALILLDGVPVTDPFGGWMNWSTIPRAAVNSVELLRGGASDLYGGQALSGVVQMLTRIPETADADLDVSYGNERTPNASGYIGHVFGKWTASLAGEYFRTDGYIPVESSERGLVDNPANSLHRNGELFLQRQISQRSRFFVRGLGYDDSRHNGTIIEVNRTRAWQAVAGLDVETASGDLLQLRGYGGAEDYHQTFASVAAGRASESLARVQTVPSRQWGLSAQYSHLFSPRNTLLAGVDAASVTGESDDEIFIAGNPSSLVNAGGHDVSVGIFAEDIARLTSRWIVTGVLRVDDWQTLNGFSNTTSLLTSNLVPTSFPNRSETAFAPKLASSYHLNDHIELRGSLYRSFRTPTLNELYRSFRLGNIVTLANQQLRAERLTGWEAGPAEKLLNGKLRLQQSFFWASVHRPVANVTLSTTPALITRMRENIGSTRALGFESQADWELMQWADLAAQYQFVDATVTSFPANPILVGNLVPEVPRHEFTFQARYNNPAFFTAAVQARSSSSVFDDDLNTLPLDSYFKLDAFLSRRISSNMDVYIAGENLLNQHFMVARTPIVTLGSPLTARVGIQLHLRR